MSQPEVTPMKYRLEFVVHELPRIPNNGSHGSYWQVVQEKRKWEKLIVFQIGLNRPPSPLALSKLTLTRFSSVEPDYDNLTASFKKIVDILRDQKIIANDKMGNFVGGKPNYLFQKTAPKNGHIRVLLEEP